MCAHNLLIKHPYMTFSIPIQPFWNLSQSLAPSGHFVIDCDTSIQSKTYYDPCPIGPSHYLFFFLFCLIRIIHHLCVSNLSKTSRNQWTYQAILEFTRFTLSSWFGCMSALSRTLGHFQYLLQPMDLSGYCRTNCSNCYVEPVRDLWRSFARLAISKLLFSCNIITTTRRR